MKRLTGCKRQVQYIDVNADISTGITNPFSYSINYGPGSIRVNLPSRDNLKPASHIVSDIGFSTRQGSADTSMDWGIENKSLWRKCQHRRYDGHKKTYFFMSYV